MRILIRHPLGPRWLLNGKAIPPLSPYRPIKDKTDGESKRPPPVED